MFTSLGSDFLQAQLKLPDGCLLLAIILNKKKQNSNNMLMI